MQQRSPEWYQARCGRITGSRFAKAMSGRHTDGYRKLVDALVEERSTGRVNEGGYTSPAMQWGIDHEDAARRWYSKAKNHPVSQIGFVTHPEFDFVGVSPDGLVGADGLVEIKCPQPSNFRRVADTRSLPTIYHWQVQGQLWVCQRRWLDFVCFQPPGQGIIVPVAFDRGEAAKLADRCLEINGEVERRLRARAPGPKRAAPVDRTVPAAVAPQARAQQPAPPVSRDGAGTPISEEKFQGWGWVLIVVVLLLLGLWGF